MIPNFSNFEEEGPGVEADLPPLPPVKRFFVIFGRKFIKLLWLNALFLLTCIPVVTVGASLCGLARVCRKFSLEEPCFAFSEYFDGFKAGFRRGLLPGVCCTIWVAVLTAELLYLFAQPLSGEQIAMFVPAIVLSGVFLIMQFYFWNMLDCLDLPVRAVYKNALFLTVLGILRNIPLVIGIIAVFWLFTHVPLSLFLLLFMPFSQICYLITFTCHPVIERFIINPYYAREADETESEEKDE
ncbi:hypothetical protein FACS1894120_1440 [Clostridia bacterium]|nr:hypothetical protein FACS1894120_1440 [Clostridia bacterium]